MKIKNMKRFRTVYIIASVAIIILVTAIFTNVYVISSYNNAKELYNEADYVYLQNLMEDTILSALDSNGQIDNLSITVTKGLAECTAEVVDDEVENVTFNWQSQENYERNTITLIKFKVFLLIGIAIGLGILSKMFYDKITEKRLS